MSNYRVHPYLICILVSVLLVTIVALLSGCSHISPVVVEEIAATIANNSNKADDVPETVFGNINTGENLPGSISEFFTVKPKSYDQTYRIAFPSTFLNEKIVDSSSYVLVNGEHRATYRGRDWDHGANRPKYTLDLNADLPSPSLFELFTGAGAKVAEIESGIPNGGQYLPNQGVK